MVYNKLTPKLISSGGGGGGGFGGKGVGSPLPSPENTMMSGGIQKLLENEKPVRHNRRHEPILRKALLFIMSPPNGNEQLINLNIF